MKKSDQGLSKLLRKKRYLRFYILGFVDAEGCFSVSLKRQKTTRFGWVLDPIFQVTQHKSSKTILEHIKKELGCGRIIEKPGQKDTLIFLVDNRRQIKERVIPFFEKYRLLSKNGDFQKFNEIVTGLENKMHYEKETFMKLVKKAFKMNLEGKQRRHKLNEVLKELESKQNPQRPYAKHPSG